MRLTVTEAQHGMLLRNLLKQMHISSKMMRHLKFLPNGILINGVPVTVRYLLQSGDVLELATEDDESAPIKPVDLPIAILYEDDDLVVPAKPADMPTHPSHDHYEDTVANALAYRYTQCGVPFVFRPINRLDRNTSGLLLIARNRMAAGRLTEFMQTGRIQKRYLAILDGEMTKTGGVIDKPLHRTAESIILREVCSPDAPDAAPSRTEYTVLATGGGHTLVEARPITGRTHQLRVHFASIGHPITADDLYGTPSPLLSRHALHAYKLTFPHPADETKILTLTAPLPLDLERLLTACFPKETLPTELL